VPELQVVHPFQPAHGISHVSVDRGMLLWGRICDHVKREAGHFIPSTLWREFNPEDTIRFYALRLHEAGMVKANPQRIIAQGTDRRFLTDLRKELILL
jgi:hypothetical protein